MLITTELLRKHKGCEQGIKYIERFYPEGAEIMTLIRDRHINKEFLHWGREHLSVTDEELAAYCEVCRIVNTDGFWYSQDVHDSKYIVKSKNIEGSTSIFESTDIIDSTDVVGSESIEYSHQIFYSSMVDTSKKIFKSQNITESVNICGSTMVARSLNVIDSSNVFDSTEIIRCSSVSNSHFCQDSKNLKNCMFCYEIENAEYHIFNTPVDKSLYELIEKQYKKYMNEPLSFIRDWPSEMLISQYVIPTRKFDDWFYTIPPRFWKWVRTLPNFDGMLLYNITMNPDLLTE